MYVEIETPPSGENKSVLMPDPDFCQRFNDTACQSVMKIRLGGRGASSNWENYFFESPNRLPISDLVILEYEFLIRKKQPKG
jgi:hypothetical protein